MHAKDYCFHFKESTKSILCCNSLPDKLQNSRFLYCPILWFWRISTKCFLSPLLSVVNCWCNYFLHRFHNTSPTSNSVVEPYQMRFLQRGCIKLWGLGFCKRASNLLALFFCKVALNCTQISQQPLLLMFLECLCIKHH